MVKRQTVRARALTERAAETKQLIKMELLERELAGSVERGIKQLLEDDYSEKDWTVIYDSTKGGRSELLDREVIDDMRGKARFMYWQGNEFIRRAVRNSMNYIVGKGMTFTLVRGKVSGAVADQVNVWWKLWSKHNKWAGKQREIVERGCLDGEIFLRWAERKEILCVRFLEPEDINDPTPATVHPGEGGRDLRRIPRIRDIRQVVLLRHVRSVLRNDPHNGSGRETTPPSGPLE